MMSSNGSASTQSQRGQGNVDNVEEILCNECGADIWIDDSGASHHWSADSIDDIDHDADADHTPYSDEVEGF